MDGSSGSSDDESYVQGSCSSDDEPDINRAAMRREAAELEFKASYTPTKDTELLVKVMNYYMSEICPSIDAFVEEHGGEFEELRREQSHEGMALHSNFRDVVEESAPVPLSVPRFLFQGSLERSGPLPPLCRALSVRAEIRDPGEVPQVHE